MRPSFRILAAHTAWVLAAAAAAPALAQTAPGVVAPDGEACAPVMARWQSAEARYSALSPADLDRYNAVQNEIDRAAHFCEAGRDADAKAIMAGSKRPAPALQ